MSPAITPDAIRAGFLADLTAAAPDLDAGTIGEQDHLQDDLGLDSMDVLNLVAALHRRWGPPIPETDHARIATPARAVACLTEMLAR